MIPSPRNLAFWFEGPKPTDLMRVYITRQTVQIELSPSVCPRCAAQHEWLKNRKSASTPSGTIVFTLTLAEAVSIFAWKMGLMCTYGGGWTGGPKAAQWWAAVERMSQACELTAGDGSSNKHL